MRFSIRSIAALIAVHLLAQNVDELALHRRDLRLVFDSYLDVIIIFQLNLKIDVFDFDLGNNLFQYGISMILVLLPDLIYFLQDILLILRFICDPYVDIPSLSSHVKVFIGKLILIEIILFHDSCQLVLRKQMAKVTVLIHFE